MLMKFTSAWSARPKMEFVSQPMSTDPFEHRKELVERLDILRRNENFCDVTIIVKGKEFKAHRAVLAAASPFFLTLLTSDMREGNEQLIRMELEEATESVMEEVLKYIYTGNVLVTEERAHGLIATANYLLLPSLKTLVDNFLKEVVSVENCVFNYYFADKYQCVELKEKCCEMIDTNFSVVIETDDFLNLDMKQVMEWVSSDDVTVNAEEEVFKGIVKWVSHNKSEREGDFPELLQQVRLTSISHDFLLNELVKEELITKNPEFCSNFVVDAMKLMLLSATDWRASQQPRKCLETHADGIFVCGGRKALCYFPKQNLWYRLQDTPFEYQNHTLTECKSKIYIVDGQTHNLGESRVMEYYVPLTNSWGAIQRDATGANFTCCTVLKGYLYATYFSRFNVTICRYDTEMDCWHEVDAPPTQPEDPCVVADEQFLYIIGGTNDYGISSLSSTTRFDSSSNKWEDVAAINKARYNAFGAALNGKVFIAGGLTSRKFYVLSCEAYNPSTNEWHIMSKLNLPRFNASMVCFGGRLYVLGGSTCTDRYIRALAVEMFDSEKNEWTEISAIPVKTFETQLEEKTMNKYQACFARLYKGVIDKLNPLKNKAAVP